MRLNPTFWHPPLHRLERSLGRSIGVDVEEEVPISCCDDAIGPGSDLGLLHHGRSDTSAPSGYALEFVASTGTQFRIVTRRC